MERFRSDMPQLCGTGRNGRHTLGFGRPAGCRFLLGSVPTLILHLALVEAHRWIRPQAGRIVKQLTLDSPGAASAHKRWRLEANSASSMSTALDQPGITRKACSIALASPPDCEPVGT